MPLRPEPTISQSRIATSRPAASWMRPAFSGRLLAAAVEGDAGEQDVVGAARDDQRHVVESRRCASRRARRSAARRSAARGRARDRRRAPGSAAAARPRCGRSRAAAPRSGRPALLVRTPRWNASTPRPEIGTVLDGGGRRDGFGRREGAGRGGGGEEMAAVDAHGAPPGRNAKVQEARQTRCAAAGQRVNVNGAARVRSASRMASPARASAACEMRRLRPGRRGLRATGGMWMNCASACRIGTPPARASRRSCTDSARHRATGGCACAARAGRREQAGERRMAAQRRLARRDLALRRAESRSHRETGSSAHCARASRCARCCVRPARPNISTMSGLCCASSFGRSRSTAA